MGMSRRRSAPNFARACSTCDSTVRTDSTSRWLICTLVSPSATRRQTSSSRSVSVTAGEESVDITDASLVGRGVLGCCRSSDAQRVQRFTGDSGTGTHPLTKEHSASLPEGVTSCSPVPDLLQFMTGRKDRLGIVTGDRINMSASCARSRQIDVGVSAQGRARLRGGDGAVEEACVGEDGPHPCGHLRRSRGSGTEEQGCQAVMESVSLCCCLLARNGQTVIGSVAALPAVDGVAQAPADGQQRRVDRCCTCLVIACCGVDFAFEQAQNPGAPRGRGRQLPSAVRRCPARSFEQLPHGELGTLGLDTGEETAWR